MYKSAFEENEISIKANGGTELMKRRLSSKIDPVLMEDFQVIASRIRTLDEDKIRVYWLHDLPMDPETNHLKDANSRDRFHKIVFCNNWQYNQYVNVLGVPQTFKCAVIENAIEPIDYIVKKSKEEVRLIYTSTPQRGLAILVPVFVELAKKYPNIKLDVFSSFSIYGWGQADEQFRELFDICRSHPQINYHGAQPNEVVREHLQKAHIFSYPSIWQECNSIATIEAMSAGCLCLHPNFAGLSDTSGGLTSMYQYDENPNTHAIIFYQLLEKAILSVHDDNMQSYLRFVKAYTDSRFNISKIAAQWEDLMRSLKHEYPTVDTRKIPKQMFKYKTI
jgi:UDP-glucose:(glucosyl)LPS alpha-1,2-glucosyltransferase